MRKREEEDTLMCLHDLSVGRLFGKLLRQFLACDYYFNLFLLLRTACSRKESMFSALLRPSVMQILLMNLLVMKSHFVLLYYYIPILV